MSVTFHIPRQRHQQLRRIPSSRRQ